MNCDKKEEKEEEEGKRDREEIEGKRLSPLRLFDAGTIFKLSASAYDAHVKSCRVDFRFARTKPSEKTPEKRGECAPPPGTPRVK